MLRNPNRKDSDESAWQKLYEQCVADMLSEPDLTEAEKQELLRQLELPDDKWELTELPEGAEPLSETIIKMRRGN